MLIDKCIFAQVILLSMLSKKVTGKLVANTEIDGFEYQIHTEKQSYRQSVEFCANLLKGQLILVKHPSLARKLTTWLKTVPEESGK